MEVRREEENVKSPSPTNSTDGGRNLVASVLGGGRRRRRLGM